MDDGGYEVVVRDGEGRPLGAIAVHSTVRGRARGGLRFSPAADADEVRPLARAMTLKYGFLGLPQGGAKAAVRGDPDAPPAERRARLAAFAAAAAPLLRSRAFLPDADVGTTAADVRALLAVAGVRVRRREWTGDRSGLWTAWTVIAAAREAAARRGFALAGCRIAIEGFGAVGSALATLAAGEGARVVAVSTSRGGLHAPDGLDVPRLVAAAAAEGSGFVTSFPARRIAAGEVPGVDADVLCPCAVGATVHEGNQAAVTARAVVPGANLPLTPGAEAALEARGVLCVPDFLAGCGGVAGGTLEFAGADARAIVDFVEREIGPRIGRALDRAERDGVPPRAAAEARALARHAELRARAGRRGPKGLALDLALGLHRRGAAPRALVGAAAVRWLRAALAGSA